MLASSDQLLTDDPPTPPSSPAIPKTINDRFHQNNLLIVEDRKSTILKNNGTRNNLRSI